MPSPVEPDDIAILADTAALCDKMQAVTRLPIQFKAFLDWLLGDDGELSDEVLIGFQDRVTPIGAILGWVSTSLPSDKWLICNGQTVTIAAYPSLFALLGIRFGGDGVTNFTLPDLQDRALVGVSATKLIGGNYGAESVDLDLSHYHGIAVTSVNDNINFPTRNWAKTDNGTVAPGVGISGDDVDDADSGVIESGDIASTTEIKDDNTGDLSAVTVATIPKSTAVYFIIKAL